MPAVTAMALLGDKAIPRLASDKVPLSPPEPAE
jgi:hypothetical protein